MQNNEGSVEADAQLLYQLNQHGIIVAFKTYSYQNINHIQSGSAVDIETVEVWTAATSMTHHWVTQSGTIRGGVRYYDPLGLQSGVLQYGGLSGIDMIRSYRDTFIDPAYDFAFESGFVVAKRRDLGDDDIPGEIKLKFKIKSGFLTQTSWQRIHAASGAEITEYLDFFTATNQLPANSFAVPTLPHGVNWTQRHTVTLMSARESNIKIYGFAMPDGGGSAESVFNRLYLSFLGLTIQSDETVELYRDPGFTIPVGTITGDTTLYVKFVPLE